MLCIFVMTSIVFLTSVLGEECAIPTFNNTVVTFNIFTEGHEPSSITGCITSETVPKNSKYPNQKLADIDIVAQTIPQFHEGAVTNLVNLEYIIIKESVIGSIKSGAFSNLPVVDRIKFLESGITTLEPSFLVNMSSLDKVYLSSNKIKILQPSTFKDLPRLSSVHLDHNQLDFVEGSWFKNTPKLILINVSNNKIRSIFRASFVDIPSLETLQLNSNQIEQIHPNAFVGLANLRHLNLGSNRLKSLDFKFSDLLVLRNLQVYFNNLTYISDEVLHDLPATLKVFYFFPNPLQCGCYHKLDKWSADNGISAEGTYNPVWVKCHANNPVCVESENGESECLEGAHEELDQIFYKNHLPCF